MSKTIIKFILLKYLYFIKFILLKYFECMIQHFKHYVKNLSLSEKFTISDMIRL